MRSKVYLETTVVSYLTARPSRDLIVAAHQQITSAWWQQREHFDLFISEAVLEEARRGDATAADAVRYKIEGVCRLEGYEPPVICTPEELMEPWP